MAFPQAPTEDVVRSVVNNDLSDPTTQIALAVVARANDAMRRMFVVDSDYPTLDDAYNAVSDYGVLKVREQWSRTTPLVLDRPVCLEWEYGGSVSVTTGSTDGIQITSNDVTLVDARVSGAGATVAGTGKGISAIGTALAPISNLQLRGTTHVDSFDYIGVYLNNVIDSDVERLAVSSISYAGFMGLSCINVTVNGGAVRTLTMPAGFTNSYGLAFTRDSTQSMSAAPRSQDCTVEDLLVSGVPLWEGLDTHAGQNITFRNCKVYGCKVGIALVAGKGTDGTNTYAPQACTVDNCYIDSQVSNGTAGVGIVLGGAADTLGAATELAADCILTNNRIANHGTQNTSSGSSIQLFGTVAARVAHNTIRNSGFSSIDFYHDNYGAQCVANTLIDTWTNNATSTFCIQIRSDHNSVMVQGTQIVRGPKIANIVNDRGLNAATSGMTDITIVDAGGNNFDAANTATAGIVNWSSTRFFAAKTGINGNTPVAKVSRPAAATGTDAATINALSTALINVGILS